MDSNLGAIIQYAPSEEQSFMLGVTRTSNQEGMGYNPFRSGRGWAIVGEYTQAVNDKLTLRINPFYDYAPAPNGIGGEGNFGMVGSAEYQICDQVATFIRTGFGTNQELGGTAEVSFGAHISPFSSREGDYLGIAYGVFQNDGSEAVNSTEKVLEVFYNCQITDWFAIVPHIQYVVDPAFNDQEDETIFFGVQAVITF